MFKNYLVTALRNIVRHKLYSFINIAGLAVGLACVIFVLLFIRDELSYDKWIPGTDNLYRVEMTVRLPGQAPLARAAIPFPMAAAMLQEIPGVTAMTRYTEEAMTLQADGRQFMQPIRVVDPNFFRVIKMPLLAGDPDKVFQNPESVVLSETGARKLFGYTNPIGRLIKTTANCAAGDIACPGRMMPLKVTGIMRDIPNNSQFDGDLFLPHTSAVDRLSQSIKQDWYSAPSYGYVALAPGTNPKIVASKMGPILDRSVTDKLHSFGARITGHQAYSIHLTPLTDVHLTADHWVSNNKPPGSWTTVYGVAIIGGLILLVACFNFTNLATARAMVRAREIALRKTVGASRRQLIAQFLGEAVLMALLALALSFALVELLLPVLDDFLQRPLSLHYVSDWKLLLLLIGVAIVTGLIGGTYPALVLSGFRPAVTLRGNSAGPSGAGGLRSFLVVLQFAVSIALGIAAAVVFDQVNYARNLNLGFRYENLLVIYGNGLLTASGRESFVQQLRSHPEIQDIAMSTTLPFQPGQTPLASVRVPGNPETTMLNRRDMGVNAPNVLGMRLVAGRLLSDSREQDEIYVRHYTGDPRNEGHNILIDEAAAARLGFTPAGAVGKTVIFNKSHVHIVGVLANVKFDGARQPAEASTYVYDPTLRASAIVRIRPGVAPASLRFVDQAWHAFAPTKAVGRIFLNDSFDELYQADEHQGTLFAVFVGVAIFIACLGLFGLAAFSTERRTREIGLRKTFGASAGEIVRMLLWQFSIPVLIANAIAWPVAWYYLQGWLLGFAYRITLGPVYFLGAGAVALVIAWATVFIHARRVADANPVHALRYE